MSLLPSGAIETTGYDINNSLRFRSAASAYLLRTPASAGNRKTFTISFWFKRGTLGVDQKFLSAYSADSDSGNMDFRLTSGNILYWGPWSTGMTTAAVFRDPSAWYHVVLTIDTTQATGANRHRVYVNGVEYTFSGTPVTQNTDLAWNNTIAHNIGRNARTSGDYFDGYMTEFYSIDGQALTPSSFGETDAITGVWKPKAYSGTYGTNGFYLKFANDSSSLSYQYGALLNGSSQFVSLTPTSAFNFSNNNWTIEAFVWPNSQTNQVLFNYGYEGSTNRAMVIYYSGGNLNLAYSTNGTNNTDTSFGAHNMQSNQWNHIAIVRNGSTITAYINGISLPTTINISTSSIHYPGTSGAFRIGRDSTNYLNAFIHGFRIVNGTAVYTSKFKPTTTKLTAIANTQLLTLQDSTLIDNSPNNFTLTNNGSFTISYGVVPYAAPSIATDYSGNYNNWFIGTGWNVNDISDQSYSVMYDSPTLTSSTVANYCTLNPLESFTNPVPQQANLYVPGTDYSQVKGTFWVSTGKWYYEWVSVGSNLPPYVGVSNASITSNTNVTTSGISWYGHSNSYYKNFTGTSLVATSAISVGDVIGVAFDCDAGTVAYYKNNSLVHTDTTLTPNQLVAPTLIGTFSGGSWSAAAFNFGQRPFAYTPPTGFNRLNTFNLPTSTIVKGNTVMDATLYTGNGANRSITNAGAFRPDLVWGQARSAAYGSWLYDAVRGATKQLESFGTNAESTQSTMVTAFNSDGFNIGTDTAGNQSSVTYVAWQWQAGSSTVTNTSGSISAQVRANTTTGFSIVTYTGSGAAGTIGHGLGVAPAMIMTKNRTSSGNSWVVWHKSLTNAYSSTTGFIYLNQTAAASTTTNFYDGTAMTSSTFRWQTGNINTNSTSNNYVSYVWAEIAGFSRFGSYTGNGSADGPFVYTGFRPKFLLVRRSDAVENWIIYDTARSAFNVADKTLQPNSSGAEGTNDVTKFDILSNGFKCRNSGFGNNTNGGTYIYMAFAENPFKNSLAR